MKSTVKISNFDASNVDRVKFFGTVKSKKAVCEKARKVTLRQTDQGLVAGKAKTNKKGKWTVVFDGNTINPGNFKVAVAKKVVKQGGKKTVCGADTFVYEVKPA